MSDLPQLQTRILEVLNDDGSLAGDGKLVQDTWLGTYRSSKRAGVIPNNYYNLVTWEAVKQLIRRGATVLGVVDPEYPRLVLGWICHERTRAGEPIVHYVFVKDHYRKKGVAKLLFEKIGLNYKNDFFFITFWTKFAKYFPRGYHEPAIARRKSA